MSKNLNATPDVDSEEIDVTEIIERLEKLEKENRDQKEKISADIASLTTRVGELEESIDSIAESL